MIELCVTNNTFRSNSKVICIEGLHCFLFECYLMNRIWLFIPNMICKNIFKTLIKYILIYQIFRSTIESKSQKPRKKTSREVSEKSPKSRNLSKSNQLTIDIPSSDIAKIDEEHDVDIHEYVNLVDIQRYRDEAYPTQNFVGSNPLLNFPNVIGYASTQHILALYGNPRTPLLPDYFQRGSTSGLHTQVTKPLSRLTLPHSPMDNHTKTMSNSDLRSQHTNTLLTRFSQHNYGHPVTNRRACSTLDISDHRAARHYRNHVPPSRGNLTLDYHRPTRNIGSNDVVY